MAWLVARVGLLAWMNPSISTHAAGELQGRVTALAGDLERVPAETRSMLQTLLADPSAAFGGSIAGASTMALSCSGSLPPRHHGMAGGNEGCPLPSAGTKLSCNVRGRVNLRPVRQV